MYVVLTAATFALTRLRGVAMLADYVHLAVGALFLMVAFRMAQREPGGMRRYGIDLAGVLAPTEEPDDRPPGPLGLFDLARAVAAAIPQALRELGFALRIVAVIFPPFALGFWWWHEPSHPFEWTTPPDLGSFALAQLIVVGLPEEALFRGYFQTRLTDHWPRRIRMVGTWVSPAALLTQAAFFAVMHFAVDLDPRRLAVFFPGLLFGWIRARRDGIGAAILLHALSNVYSEILMRGWL